jgi:hypothetical protein
MSERHRSLCDNPEERRNPALEALIEKLRKKYGECESFDVEGVDFNENILSKYHAIIEHNLLITDSVGREALLKRLLSKLQMLGFAAVHDGEYVDSLGCDERENRIKLGDEHYSGFLGCRENGQFFGVFDGGIRRFFEEFVDLFDAFNMKVEDYLSDDAMMQIWADVYIDREIAEMRRSLRPKQSTAEKKYSTLPRTHRIAAVNELLHKLKTDQSVDKTKIAEFVEAVTGGNTEVKGQDTMSYKKPTKDATAAAQELLKRIGL